MVVQDEPSPDFVRQCAQGLWNESTGVGLQSIIHFARGGDEEEAKGEMEGGRDAEGRPSE